MRIRPASAWAWTWAVVMLEASRAGAVDGVIEINQASALSGGISVCDSPGFPVEICGSGSYRLTSDLHFPSATAGGIRINSSDVTIDLNGMTIEGDNVCTNSPNGWVTSCVQGGSIGAGIDATGRPRVHVRNGRVVGANGFAVVLESDSQVEDVSVSQSEAGVWVGDSARLRGVSATSNDSVGIRIGEDSKARDLIATGNSLYGVYMSLGSTAENVSAGNNRQAGVFLFGSRLSGVAAAENGESGVSAGDGSMVEAGVLRDNGKANPSACGLQGAGGAGFHAMIITATVGGNPSKSCGAVNLGSNSCQGAACP